MSETRTIRIEALSRVEGEGALTIRLRGNAIDDVQLNIYEPPRFFEAFLRGRSLEEVPDITARICGICPVAYQMTSVHALEAALGVTVSPEIRRLRRLLYCGEWIESHALHMHLLNAPDFFGADSGIHLAETYPQEVTRGLRLKKHGNELLEVLGGRAIHPINVAVGGFYRAPKREELAALIPAFEWGLQAAVDATRWVAGFPFPEFRRHYEMVALSHPNEYPMNEGHIVSTAGLSLPVADYPRHFAEEHVAHSTALQAGRVVPEPDAAAPSPASSPPAPRPPYFVGPLARVNLNRDQLSPTARRVADEVGIAWPCFNPFQNIVARGLEVIHAYEEALDILKTYVPPRPARAPLQFRNGSGCAATEAPRGLMYHRYSVDEAGQVAAATIIPPTSQNQRQIEDDLRNYLLLPGVLVDDLDETGLACERLVRTYDPCISCSTHFLKVQLVRS